MAQITIGSRFFRNEARSYSNPALGLWRELIQNSVDNGASKINITTKMTDGYRDIVTVTFADNGTGMSREVLEQVYFCLGETTKGGDGDIGGFGRARLLTCFAQEAYTIRTQNVNVYGSGSEYEIEDTTEFHNGCSFEIEVHLPTMKATPHWNSDEVDGRLLEALHGYLSKCQFSSAVDVTINGIRFTDYLMRRAKRGDLSFGTIHVVKKPNRNGGMVYVRVRGALMFEKNLYGSNALVIVEIDPALSRDVLVSNRDSLNYKYDEELDALIQALAVNTLSGLNESKSETIISAGGYRVVTKRDLSLKSRKKEVPVEDTVIETSVGSLDGKVSDDIIDAINDTGTDRGQHTDVPRPRMTSGGGTMVIERSTGTMVAPVSVPSGMTFAPSAPIPTGERVQVSVVEVEETEEDPLTQGMYFILDSTDAKVRAAARKWQQRYLVSKGPGRNRRKLFAQWVVACEWAISAFEDLEGGVIVAWAPGVYFKDTAMAGHQEGTNPNSHAFMFNPLDEKGRLCYELDSIEDHADLLASAAHEVGSARSVSCRL